MIKFYDSRLRKVVDFKPLKRGQVSMYVCGPTVYDRGHLGHGRSAVAFDVIRKYLEYSGHKVMFVSNYTDVDDKMINRAAEEGISVPELAKKIIPLYERDFAALKVKVADEKPRATDYIEEMIDLVKILESKGFTYVLDDGVYFDVSKFEAYGEFSGQVLEDLKVGARVDVKEGKKNPYDFVVWKFKKEGEPNWKSPWGDGRPGWHIECSAMSRKLLGEKFDIHGGGLDLKFPHHECEVAQSEAAFGYDAFAKYWIHNGFINVDNVKMSKSLGNFFTLEDVFKKYDPSIVRFMFLQTHYRNPINFSDVLLDQAKAGLKRLNEFVSKLRLGYDSLPDKSSESFDFDELVDQIKKFMDNDFDVSGVLGVVFELMNRVNALRNEGVLSKKIVDETEKFLKSVDYFLEVIFPDDGGEIGEDVEVLIKKRESARKSGDYKLADEIRKDLKEKGIELEDTSAGTIWKKA